MTIKRRKGSDIYYMYFTRKDGERVRQSTGTSNRAKAQQLHDKLKNASWDADYLNKKRDYSWKEAAIRYRKDKINIKSQEFITGELKNLDKHLSDLYLSDITVEIVDKVKYSRLEDTYQRRPNGVTYGTSGNTVNKTLALLKAILMRAKNKWHWIDSIPTINFVEIRKDMQSSYNWLTYEEAERLLKELPPHLQYMMRFSLATGLREANVTGLKWKNVDLGRRCAYVDAIESKNNSPIRIPLNDDAMEVLQSLKGTHETNVFSYKRNTIQHANTAAWRKALDRAGIRAHCPSLSDGIKVNEMYPTKDPHEYSHKDFRWHDLRHTWASWHVQAGTPLLQLQMLGCWKTYEMVCRYAHLGNSHIDTCANNISLKKNLGGF